MAASPTASALGVVPVESPRARRRFVKVPRRIYAKDPLWVPPLIMERLEHIDPKKNPFFQHAEAAFWLAERNGEAVGRISAQIDHLHIERYADATGFIGMLEGEDPAILARLLAEAEGWLKNRGMRRARGPLSLSMNDECGILVSGFDTPPSMMMGHAPSWYGSAIEAAGYAKARDLIAYDFDVTKPLPPAAQRIIKRTAIDKATSLRPMRPKEIEADVDIVVDIFNDAWSDNWGFIPFTKAEIAHFAKSLKMIIDPNLVWIAEIEGEPVAMALAMPNLNEVIADLDGRLLPFGLIKLLWRLKRGAFKTARLPLLGVRRRFRGSVVGGALALQLIEAIRTNGIKRHMERAELSWILDDNVPMKRMIELVGATPYKTYRIYEKALG